MAIALDYTQVDISDDGATFGTAIRTQFQNAQADLGNRPEKNGTEILFGDWTFAIGDIVFDNGFESTGLADFSAGQVDIRTPMYFKNNGVMRFNNNPTHDGNCSFGGEIAFNNRYFYSYLTTSETITDSPTYTVLPFDNDVRSDDLYSNTAGVITINSDGWYKISYTGTADNLQVTYSDRWTVNFRVEVDAGGGFSKLVGSDTYSYNRNSEDGKNSVSTTVFVNFSAGDKLRVSAATVSDPPSGGDVVSVANACNISIERV